MHCSVGSLRVWGFIAACLIVFLCMGGCSRGGSHSGSDEAAKAEDSPASLSDSDSTGESDSAAGASYGKVGVLLTDGPADEYEHIWVTVTEVSLLPTGESDDAGKVVLFSSSDGYRFDLLQYRDEDFLLTLKEKVPCGTYEKIRLKVIKVEAEGGPCAEMEIKVPSGKIDLNPRSPIMIEEGSTLYIRLDIDANKSINLHTAGNSGKCIFRPVVFADVLAKHDLPDCPTFIAGKVKAVQDSDEDGMPESFTLAREFACLGSIQVKLSEDTLVFNENGRFCAASEIKVDQSVSVRGLFDDGCFDAELVILGHTLPLVGTVRAPVSGTGFTLDCVAGEAIIGSGSVEVTMDELTPVYSGCNTPLDGVEEGMRVLVIGKYDIAAGKLYAAIVLVKPNEVEGTISDVERCDGVYYISVLTSDGDTIRIKVGSDTNIFIEGDGSLPQSMIPLLDLVPYHVRIAFGSDTTEMWITLGSIVGEVKEISAATRSVLVDDTWVKVMLLATGLSVSEDGDELISFNDIQVGDQMTCFGFDAGSESSTGFHAFVFVVK